MRRAGDRLVSTAAMEAVAAKLVALVKAFHAQQPLSEGLPREEARAQAVREACAGAVFETVMQGLTAARASSDRERLALPAHKMALPGGEATVAGGAIAAYRAGGLDAAGSGGALQPPQGAAPRSWRRSRPVCYGEKVLVKLDTLVASSRGARRA